MKERPTESYMDADGDLWVRVWRETMPGIPLLQLVWVRYPGRSK